MRIYAIRDRLIDYFMRPFFLENDKAAMQAIAEIVNDKEGASAIAQTPHQFELWRLADIEENGEVKGSKEYLGDASGLIRTGVRPDTNRRPGSDESKDQPEPRRSTPSGDRGYPGTLPSTHKNQATAGSEQAPEARPGLQRMARTVSTD